MSRPDLKKSSMTPEPSQKRPDRLGLQGTWLIHKCFLQPSGISPPGSQLLTHRPLLLSLLPVCFCFAYCPPFFSSLHSQHLHSAQLGLNPNHLLSLSEDLNQEAFLGLLKQGMCPTPPVHSHATLHDTPLCPLMTLLHYPFHRHAVNDVFLFISVPEVSHIAWNIFVRFVKRNEWENSSLWNSSFTKLQLSSA